MQATMHCDKRIGFFDSLIRYIFHLFLSGASGAKLPLVQPLCVPSDFRCLLRSLPSRRHEGNGHAQPEPPRRPPARLWGCGKREAGHYDYELHHRFHQVSWKNAPTGLSCSGWDSAIRR